MSKNIPHKKKMPINRAKRSFVNQKERTINTRVEIMIKGVR